MSRYVFGRYVEADLREIRDYIAKGEYLILYLAAKTPIQILAVIHGARDVPAIVNRCAD